MEGEGTFTGRSEQPAGERVLVAAGWGRGGGGARGPSQACPLPRAFGGSAALLTP